VRQILPLKPVPLLLFGWSLRRAKLSKNKLPKLRYHRASGQAVVELSGKQFYLGKHGSDEAQENYNRHVAEWLANGRKNAEPTPTMDEQLGNASQSDCLTVVELCDRYKSHCDQYYVDEKKQATRTIERIKIAIKWLRTRWL
jgi:hypothetical protein